MAKKKRPWSLLSSHGLVLVTVARHADLSVPEICEKTGLSRSTVLNTLKALGRSRMLKARRVDRRDAYNIAPHGSATPSSATQSLAGCSRPSSR